MLPSDFFKTRWIRGYTFILLFNNTKEKKGTERSRTDVSSLCFSQEEEEGGGWRGGQEAGLVVGHVSRGGAELGVGFDDFVDGFEEIFLGGDFPASSDGEHSRLCAHAPDLRSCKTTRVQFGV